MAITNHTAQHLMHLMRLPYGMHTLHTTATQHTKTQHSTTPCQLLKV
jgi:hypothetical protein